MRRMVKKKTKKRKAPTSMYGSLRQFFKNKKDILKGLRDKTDRY